MEHFHGKDMKEYCSFFAGGKADDLYIPHSVEEVQGLLKAFRKEGRDYYILGKGSNLLISDDGLRDPVILLRENLSGVQYEENRETEEACFTALSGTTLYALAKFAEEKGYSGMEPLSGIPGTVGGAVKMNAGAYNAEIKDVFLRGQFCTAEGEILSMENREMDFSYRHSAVTDGMVCLSATFLLKKGEKKAIHEKMEEYRLRRAEKQPLELPSAGSTFKRPEGDYASRLIEHAGLRGFQIENAGVSEKHCGFVVNLGNASAKNIYTVILEVIRIVKEKEGVQLEPEVKLWGKF
ncbi:MAG: UDP-N-acetylmuramate dehydrogenase [Lachnospiraceae bacterium]|nr:UDP-N-acetylmuramate dehydrogenase [Lachnospiraceae bacterium]